MKVYESEAVANALKSQLLKAGHTAQQYCDQISSLQTRLEAEINKRNSFEAQANQFLTQERVAAADTIRALQRQISDSEHSLAAESPPDPLHLSSAADSSPMSTVSAPSDQVQEQSANGAASTTAATSEGCTYSL